MKWFTNWASRKHQRENGRLVGELAELRAELAAERRRLEVAQAEIESLAAVVARDRATIQAEGAAYARKRAEAEGVNHEQHQASSERY